MIPLFPQVRFPETSFHGATLLRFWSLAERRVAERRLVVVVEVRADTRVDLFPSKRDLDEVAVMLRCFRQRLQVASRASGLCAAGGQVRVVRCAG